MPAPTTNKTRGFTLVEILIVVIILGILAAIVVPQFSTAGEDTRETAVMANVKILRDQIVLYKAQHNGNGPDVGPEAMGPGGNTLIRRITEKTDMNGQLDVAGKYGPYLSSWPPNPFSDPSVGSLIHLGTGKTPPRTGATGWYYDTDTATLSANSKEGGEASDP